MRRTDDFLEVELLSSFKDYSPSVSIFDEQQRVQKIIKGIPQNTTFDQDAPDKGNESGDNQDSKVTIIRHQEPFKQWIGRVIEIEDSDNFVAKIEGLNGNDTDKKIVRFNRHKVTIANLERFAEGAVFYWTVGLFQNEKRMMVKRSEIRFQMLNEPSPLIIKDIESEIGKVFDGISWLD